MYYSTILTVEVPVLYTVALKTTFWNMTSAIWAVGLEVKISETTEFLLKYATFWGGFFMFSWAKN